MAHARDNNPPIKPFSGSLEESYLEWKKRVFDLHARARGWTQAEKARQFPIYLQGTALNFYLALPEETQDDWPALVQAFADHFHTDLRRGAVALALRNFRQEEGQSVTEFATTLGKLLRECFYDLQPNAQEPLLGQYFHDKLLPDIREHLDLTQPNADYNQSYLLARNYENAKLLKHNQFVAPKSFVPAAQVFAGFATRSHRNNYRHGPWHSTPGRSAYSGGGNAQRFSAPGAGSSDNNYRTVQNFQSGSSDAYSCHRCGQSGHFRRSCPLLHNQSSGRGTGHRAGPPRGHSSQGRAPAHQNRSQRAGRSRFRGNPRRVYLLGTGEATYEDELDHEADGEEEGEAMEASVAEWELQEEVSELRERVRRYEAREAARGASIGLLQIEKKCLLAASKSHSEAGMEEKHSSFGTEEKHSSPGMETHSETGIESQSATRMEEKHSSPGMEEHSATGIESHSTAGIKENYSPPGMEKHSGTGSESHSATGTEENHSPPGMEKHSGTGSGDECKPSLALSGKKGGRKKKGGNELATPWDGTSHLLRLGLPKLSLTLAVIPIILLLLPGTLGGTVDLSPEDRADGLLPVKARPSTVPPGDPPWALGMDSPEGSGFGSPGSGESPFWDGGSGEVGEIAAQAPGASKGGSAYSPWFAGIVLTILVSVVICALW